MGIGSTDVVLEIFLAVLSGRAADGKGWRGVRLLLLPLSLSGEGASIWIGSVTADPTFDERGYPW
jgi:hypothetical protein